MLQVDSELAALELPTTDGEVVRLGDLWRERTSVVVWLRHYR